MSQIFFTETPHRGCQRYSSQRLHTEGVTDILHTQRFFMEIRHRGEEEEEEEKEKEKEKKAEG